jgi:hypothetical protein
MKPRLILSCAKTGRFWPVPTEQEARRKAREFGLVDYEIGPAK